MPRHPRLLLSLLAILAAVPARADRVAIPSLSAAHRAARSDAIIVGRVVEVEQERQKVKLASLSADATEYIVAVVKIEEGLMGPKGVTTLRVGIPALPDGGNPARTVVYPSLAAEQEACLFLNRHPDADFYVMPLLMQPIDKKVADFQKQVAEVRKAARVFNNPKEALRSEEAADRRDAAGILVMRYRQTPPHSGPNAQGTEEPIDAEESKLILKELAEADWMKPVTAGLTLQQAFYALGLQAKDGWTPPKFQQGQDHNKAVGEAAKQWLKSNAETYRVRRKVLN